VAKSAIAIGALLSAALAFVSLPPPPVDPVPVTAHVSGLLAGYGVAVMLIMMSRLPALERGVGADRLARWHAFGGRSILMLILVHGIAATIAWAQLQGEGLVPALVEVLGFPGLVAATVGTALFLAVGIASIRAARKRLRYETWHLLHFGTYLAIGLSFAHELAGPDLAGHPAVQAFWSLLYTAAFALVVRYRFLDPILRVWRHGMRVDSVIDEGNGVVSIVVRGRHLDDLGAEPGQFFRWRFLTRSTWQTANPFSLSAPPSDRFLRLTVKAVGDGTRAIQNVPVGTTLLAEGPYGAMTERRRSGTGVLLVAGGVGITPMRALFETVHEHGSRLTLLYRAPSKDEVLFRDELVSIAKDRGAELIVITGSSSDPRRALSAANLRRWVPDVARRDVFICASPRFSAAAHAALAEAGVPRRRVHQEEFVF
jgi:predicted ferric reductase